MGLFTGIYLAMATACQSCGILNLSLVLYNSMRHVASQTILFVKLNKKNSTKSGTGTGCEKPATCYSNEQLMNMLMKIGFSALVPGIWCIVASLSPFAAFQWFAFAAFCKLQKSELAEMPLQVLDYGKVHNLTMPGDDNKPDWCTQDPPIPYFNLGIQILSKN
jgi:hypothetical protein